MTAVPILLIVVGAVIFVIAFLGCCGAIKENTCMLMLVSVLIIAQSLCKHKLHTFWRKILSSRFSLSFQFSIILIAIVAVEVAIVVTAFTKKAEVESFIDKRLEETLHTAKTNNGFYKSWDLLQREV